MKNKKSLKLFLIIFTVISVLIIGMIVFNLYLSNLIDKANEVCQGKRFNSVAEALAGMEDEVDPSDTSLDYSPPYKLLCSFEYDEFWVVMYTYDEAYDGVCAVRLLRKNEDGTLSFNGGFTDFHFSIPENNPNYYYYTNIKTSHGTKAVSFLYLPSDNNSSLYVDGNKSDKIKVNIDDKEFYVCVALSGRDTLLKNIFVPINKRHTIRIK